MTIPCSKLIKVYLFFFFLLGASWNVNSYVRTLFMVLIFFLSFYDENFHKKIYQTKVFSYYFIFFLIFLAYMFLNAILDLSKFSYIPFEHTTLQSDIQKILIVSHYLFWIPVFSIIFSLYEKKFSILFSMTNGLNFGMLIICAFFSFSFSGGTRLLLVVEETGRTILPTHLAFKMVFVIYCNLISFSRVKSFFVKLYCVSFAFLAFAIMFATLSRGTFFFLILSLFLTSLFYKKSLLIYFVISLFFIFFIGIEKTNIFNYLPTRFSLNVMEQDKGSGRLLLWESYLKNLNAKKFFFGIGPLANARGVLYQKDLLRVRPTSYFDKQPIGASKIYVPHNIYLHILINLGIIQLILVIILLFLIGKKLLFLARHNLTYKIYLSMFITLIFSGMVDNEYIEHYMILSILLSLLSNPCLEYFVKTEKSFENKEMPYE